MSQNAGLLARLKQLLDAQAAALEGLDLEALGPLAADIDAALAALHPVAPDERRLLDGVEAARARNEELAAARLAQIGLRLARLQRGSAALRGYSPAGGISARAVAVDTER